MDWSNHLYQATPVTRYSDISRTRLQLSCFIVANSVMSAIRIVVFLRTLPPDESNAISAESLPLT